MCSRDHSPTNAVLMPRTHLSINCKDMHLIQGDECTCPWDVNMSDTLAPSGEIGATRRPPGWLSGARVNARSRTLTDEKWYRRLDCSAHTGSSPIINLLIFCIGYYLYAWCWCPESFYFCLTPRSLFSPTLTIFQTKLLAHKASFSSFFFFFFL